MRHDTYPQGERTGVLADLAPSQPSAAIDASVLQAARAAAARAAALPGRLPPVSGNASDAGVGMPASWWRRWRGSFAGWPLAPLAGVTAGGLLAVHLVFAPAPAPSPSAPGTIEEVVSRPVPAAAAPVANAGAMEVPATSPSAGSSPAVSPSAERRSATSASATSASAAHPSAAHPSAAGMRAPMAADATAPASATLPAETAPLRSASSAAVDPATREQGARSASAFEIAESRPGVQSRDAGELPPARPRSPLGAEARRAAPAPPPDVAGCDARLAQLLPDTAPDQAVLSSAEPSRREQLRVLIDHCRTLAPEWQPPERLRNAVRDALAPR